MIREKYPLYITYCFLAVFFMVYLVFLTRIWTPNVPISQHMFPLGALVLVIAIMCAVMLLMFFRLGIQRISPIVIDYVNDRYYFIELIVGIAVLGVLLIFWAVFMTPGAAMFAGIGLLFETIAIPSLFLPLYIVIMLFPLMAPDKLMGDISGHVTNHILAAIEKNDYSAYRKAAIVRNFRYLSTLITDSIKKKQTFKEGIHCLENILEHYHLKKDTVSMGWFYIEANHFPAKTGPEIEAIIAGRTWFETLILGTFEQILESTDTIDDNVSGTTLWSVPEYIVNRSLARNDLPLLTTVLSFYYQNLLHLMKQKNRATFLSLFNSFQHILPNIQKESPALLEKVSEMQSLLLIRSLSDNPSLVPIISEQIRVFNESCVTLDVLNREIILAAFFTTAQNAIEKYQYSSNRSIIFPILSDLLLLGKFYRTVEENHLLTVFKEKINASPFVEIIREIQFLRRGQDNPEKKAREDETGEVLEGPISTTDSKLKDLEDQIRHFRK